MITDLMRNDLTKITLNPARVVSRSLPLIVPGVVHQYSRIRAQVDEKTTLKRILKCLFPGGSISGAPKSRVLDLITKIESGPRGFYCGSTILLHQGKLSASINIRSAEVNHSTSEVSYGSGGGITLRSKAEEEFDEIYAKLNSFVLLTRI